MDTVRVDADSGRVRVRVITSEWTLKECLRRCGEFPRDFPFCGARALKLQRAVLHTHCLTMGSADRHKCVIILLV